jgi:hypothetical protein
MEIKKEDEERIINCGAFEYSAQKIAYLFGFDKNDVMREMDNKESKINQLLQKGKEMADYVIDLKLFEMAKIGDLKALERLEIRKSKRIRKIN